MFPKRQRLASQRPFAVSAAQRATTQKLALLRASRSSVIRKAPAELKYFDTALSFTFDSTGEVPATGQLSLIPQGVTENNRVGRKCVVTSIRVRGTQSYNPGADALASTNTYLYVYLDKQANKAAAAATDVLTGTNFSTAFPNLDNERRFKLLRKLVMHFTPQAGVTTAYNKVQKPFDFYIKCKIPLEFDTSAASGALTTITSNNIFLLAGSDGGSDDEVTMAGNCRLRFLDA